MPAFTFSLTSVLRVFSSFADSQSLSYQARSQAVAALTDLYYENTNVNNWKSIDLSEFDHLADEPKQALSAFLTVLPSLQIELLLEEFVLALASSGCSPSTIKNYRSDIKQFLSYSQDTNLNQFLTKPKVVAFVRYQREKGLKDSSITRKLKSTAQFGLWAHQHKALNQTEPWFYETTIEKVMEGLEDTSSQSVPKTQPVRNVFVPTASMASTLERVSRFSASQPVTRPEVAQKLGIFSRVKAWFTRLRQPRMVKPDKASIPADIQDWTQQIRQEVARQSQMRFLPYLNLALIILFFLGMGVFGYQQLRTITPTTLAYPTTVIRPNRVLSFQGRLTDTAENPITAATDMQFVLYNAVSGGTELWDSGTCSVDPDQDGIFSTGLGSSCGSEISSDVFSENANVWLEVRVDSETLTPRQPIQTVAYAINSETVQGFPINSTESATVNTIVVMDEFGDVVLGEVNPSIRSVAGTFTLEGRTLVFQTVSGSNGNITLTPDGTGDVIVSSDLNVLGYLAAPGATISATYSGANPLIVNGTGGQILVIDNSGNFDVAGTLTSGTGNAFTVDASGNITTGGTLAVNGDTITSDGDLTINPAGGNVLFADGDVLNIGGAAAASFNFLADSTAGNTIADGDSDLYIQDELEVDGAVRFDNSSLTFSTFTNNGGLLYTNGSGVLAQTAVGNNGECLTSVGGGTPVWSSCSAAANNYWRLNLGTISPVNDTLDFLVGGNATTSAKFAVKNINTGTPTATISANSGDIATYLTGDGTLATTNRQNLTLGNSSAYNTTGNVLLNPNGTGRVGIGTSTPQTALEVSGDIRLTTNSNRLYFGNISQGHYITDASNVLTLNTASNNRFEITNAGVITARPAGVFDIFDASGGTNQGLTISENNGTDLTSLRPFTADGASAVAYFLDTYNNLTTSGAKLISFRNDTVEKAFIDKDGGAYFGGNVGIGDTTPDAKLNILSTTEQLRLDYDDSNYTSFFTQADGELQLTTTGTDPDITLNPGTSGSLIFADLNCSGNANGGALTTDANGVVSCTDDDSGAGSGTNYWRLNLGTISPVNDTLDFLVGSNASDSAKFAVLNVNSGTPTASVSAGTNGAAYLTAAGTLQTTANQTLILGGSTTGNITLRPFNGTGVVNVTGDLDVSDQAAIGDAGVITTGQALTVNEIYTDTSGTQYGGHFTTQVEPAGSSTATSVGLFAGSQLDTAQTVSNLRGIMAQANVTAAGTITNLNSIFGQAYVDDTIAASISNMMGFNMGLFDVEDAAASNVITGNFALGSVDTGSITTNIGVRVTEGTKGSGTIGNQYGFLVDTMDNASTAGNYGLYINNVSGAASSNHAILTNAGNVTFNEGGDASTDLRIEGDTATHLFFTDASADAVGINDSTPDAKLNILATTEQLRLDYDDSNYTSFFTQADGELQLTTTGTDPDITLNPGTNGSLIFADLDCSGSANGGALTADANGVISCTDDESGAGGTNYWRANDGAVSIINDTMDLLIGSNASSSAKFAVLNVNSGTPTASVSAGTAGAAYLTAAGTLQTTANQNMTIGGSTTGNITLAPLNSAGSVTADLGATQLFNILDGNLKVGNGTPGLTLNGEDAYIEGTLEVDGNAQFDGNVTLNGSTLTGPATLTLATTTQLDTSLTTFNCTDCIDWDDIADSSTLDASSTIGFGSGALSLTFNNNGSGNEIHNLSSTGDLVIQDNGTAFVTFNDDSTTDWVLPVAGDISIDAAATDTTVTTGVLDLNVDAGNAAVLGLNIDFTQSDGATAGTDATAANINLSANDADGDVFGLTITSGATDNAAAGSYESLLKLVNAENTAGAVTDAILIDSTSSTDTDITDAIDASDANIVNALNVGANTITGAGYLVTSTGSGLTINSTSANLALQTTTSGDITLTTAAATGLANILTGNLKVGNGTPDVTLNGEDAYIEGTLEVDGNLRLDGSTITGPTSLTLATTTTLATSLTTFDCTDCINWDDIADSSTLDASSTIGFGSGALNLTFNNNGSGNEIHNLSSTGDLIIQDNGTAYLTFKDDSTTDWVLPAAGDIAIDAATTDTTVTTGVFDLNIDAGNAAVLGWNMDFAQSNGATAAVDAIAANITLSANDADGDVFGLQITSSATTNAAAGSYEALLKLVNAENTVGAVPDAILIDSTSGTDTDITDAIDASDSNIVNALNVGGNTITGAGYLVTSTGSGLTINSTSANLALQTTTSGDITLNPGGSGNIVFSDLNCTGNTNGGALTVNASGVVSCSDDDSGSAGTNYWQLNNGALSPFSLTADINLGATASSSAKVSLAGSSIRGKAVAIFNQTENQDIIAASFSGSTRFRVDTDGYVHAARFTDLANSSYFLDPAATGTGLTLAGNAGIGTTAPEHKLQVTGAVTGKALGVFNETGDQSILVASSSGTSVFEVKNDGDVVFGNPTKEDVLLTLYGDLFQPDDIKQTALSGIKGSFLYDTTRDKDGGYWRKSAISRNLSWYTESKDNNVVTVCNPSSHDRCGSNYFPAKAYITFTTSTVYIYDLSNNTLWMKLSQGSGNALGSSTNNEIRAVHGRDGKVWIGTAGSSSEAGLYELDFLTDTIYYYDTSGRTRSDENISGRNNGSNTYSNTENAYILSNSSINDIDSTYNNGDLYLAIATNAGINLLNRDYQLDYSYIEEAAVTNSGDTITDDGDAAAANDATAAFDNQILTWTRSDAADNTLIVTYQFASGKVIKRYGLKPRETVELEAPGTWTFEGSNDGSNWTVLDTQSGHTWLDIGSESNERYFVINNSTSYTYYRINITDAANSVADQVGFAEMYIQSARQKSAVRLYGADMIQNYTTPISSYLTDDTWSPRRVSDYRRTDANGELSFAGNVEAGWIDINLRNPEVHTQYMLTHETSGTQEPTDFALRASNDGVNWTTLDTRTGENLAVGQVKTYTFTNTTAYKFYRLEATNVSGAATMVFGDFILGAPEITAFSSANNTTSDETNIYLQDTDVVDFAYMWQNASGSISSQYVQYDYGTAHAPVITSYGIRGFTSAAEADRAIKDWRLQGSNNCSSWTTLDTQTNQSFADEYTLKTYTFSNSTGYRCYRLQVDANNGDASFVGVRGFYLFGAEERVFASSDENGNADNVNRVHDEGDLGAWTSFSGDVTPWIDKMFAPSQEATVSGVSLTGWQAIAEVIEDFRIQGSNDRSNWTTLLEVNRRHIYDNTNSTVPDTYMIPNDTAYQFIRLQVDDINTSTTNASLTELDLIGGVYTNVKFTGAGIAATNATTSEVNVFNQVWKDTTHRVFNFDWTDTDATDAIISHNPVGTPGTTTPSLMMPALTGAITNQKYAFSVDGNELYIGHERGFDRVELNPTFSDLDTGIISTGRANIKGSYSTTRNIVNRYNLDHYWPMDEASESTQIYDYGLGTAHSETFGFGNNLSTPVSTASGKIGRGYALDSTNEKQITIPDLSLSDQDNSADQSTTMGLWVYPDLAGAATTRYIMGDGIVDASNHYGFMLRLRAGNAINLFGADGSGLAWDYDYISKATVDSEKWSHIVVVINYEDPNNKKFEIYVNGVLVDNTAMTVGIADGSTFYFGDPFETGTFTFDGRIDEAFLAYRALTPQEIQGMYQEGLENNAPTNATTTSPFKVTATDADVTSSTTIGDTTLSLGKDQYRGQIVEITGGTGAGQSRMIVSNTATTFTVAPAWSSTPDSTSDFEITPFALPGSVNKVSALRSDQKDIFVGLNDNSNGGGVVRINRQKQAVADYYHGNAGKTDDHSNSWDTTSDYDDIVDIETTTDTLLIASEANYWRERVGDSIMEAIDKLQQGFSASLLDTHTNDSAGSSTRNLTKQVIRKGWGAIDANSTSHTEYYGITYDTTPIVLLGNAGSYSITGSPTSLSQCDGGVASDSLQASRIDREKFELQETITGGFGLCYTWLSLGNYSGSMPDGSFAGGADLAEWYGTDDETLEAGEIVAVAPSGDIKVVRSDQPQDSKAIGIIATQPSITLGPESGLTPGYKKDPQLANGAKTAVQVALAGRVPVKVSLENGIIEPGDYLTTGSVPGVAVKAISAGPTIGKAMERFDGSHTIVAVAESTSSANLADLTTAVQASVATDSASLDGKVEILDEDQQDLANGFGTIMAFVNTSYFDPSYANQPAATSNDDGTYAIDSKGKLVGLGAYSFDLIDQAKYLDQVLADAETAAAATDSANASASATLSRENILQAALARLNSLGKLSLKDLNTADLRVLSNLFARRTETDQLATDMMTPFVGNDINLQVGNASRSGQLSVKNGQGETVASIDSQGNTSLLGELLVGGDASVAGTLQAATVSATQVDAKSARLEQLESRLAQLERIEAQTAEIVNATISGTLFANDIAGFQDKVAAALEEPSLLSKLMGSNKDATDSASVTSATQLLAQAGYQVDDLENTFLAPTSASGAASLNKTPQQLELAVNDISLMADAVFIDQYFKVNGSAFIGESLGIGQNLMVDGQIQVGTPATGTSTILADGSLSFSANDQSDVFHLQPSGKGTLSLMAGLLTLDETGQAIINGDLTVAGNLKVQKTLLTNLVQPGDFTNPLQVQLATRSGEVAGATDNAQVTESRFEIINELGTPVATISAQGRATFDAGLGLGAEDLTATDSATVSTTKTTGVATVKAGTDHVIIKSQLITEDTLIYVTPVSSTGNQVLYVKGKNYEDHQTPELEGRFVVGFEQPVTKDIQFNWWIVN